MLLLFQMNDLLLFQELDKSLHNQRKIIEQQQESEAESLEMQEFLQAEKSTLADTLKELENEVCTVFFFYTLTL